jgi:hypothetical protein
MEGCRLDSLGLGKGQAEGFFENGDDLLGSEKCRDFSALVEELLKSEE